METRKEFGLRSQDKQSCLIFALKRRKESYSQLSCRARSVNNQRATTAKAHPARIKNKKRKAPSAMTDRMER
jgi:hypothetical protein